MLGQGHFTRFLARTHSHACVLVVFEEFMPKQVGVELPPHPEPADGPLGLCDRVCARGAEKVLELRMALVELLVHLVPYEGPLPDVLAPGPHFLRGAIGGFDNWSLLCIPTPARPSPQNTTRTPDFARPMTLQRPTSNV